MTALAEIFERRREVLARDAGITIEQWRVLEEISTEHFIPVDVRAQPRQLGRCGFENTAPTARRGLVSAAIGRDDRRNRSYKLTAKGHRTLAELRASRQAAIEAIWTGFSRDELAAFSTFAIKLSDRIERYSRGKNGRRAAAV